MTYINGNKYNNTKNYKCQKSLFVACGKLSNGWLMAVVMYIKRQRNVQEAVKIFVNRDPSDAIKYQIRHGHYAVALWFYYLKKSQNLELEITQEKP